MGGAYDTKRKTSAKWTILVAVLMFVAIMVFSQNNDSDSDLTPVSEPMSGQILSGYENHSGSEITVSASNSESCIVKLKTSSGIERLSFYVRAGDTVTVGVPSEYLYVYFASGNTWYGDKHLFGEDTDYQMVKNTRDFVDYTWSFTLYEVRDGNLSLKTIDKDDF